MNNDYEFGNRIYDLRRKKGLTQEDVAISLGISNKAISKWENGTSKPTISNLKKLSVVLDVTLEDLLKTNIEVKEASISRIVITGGPCSGKKTALEQVKKYFEKHGYRVVIVPALGSNSIKNGLVPSEAKDFIEYEKIQLKMQLEIEKLVDEAVNNINADKVLVLYDRGTMDVKTYTSKKEFKQILLDLNLNREDLLNKYDAVFHLKSTAKGLVSEYKSDEYSIEEAVNIENKTVAAWATHTNVRIIDNNKYFDYKINKLIKEISRFLNEDNNNYLEKKYLIKKPDYDMLCKLNGASKFKISLTYLKSRDDEDIKLVIRRSEDKVVYSKVVKSIGREEVYISADKYVSELENADPRRKRLDKERFFFIYKNNRYKVDFYPFMDDVAILELDLLNEREEFELPDFIEVIEDITDNRKYRNRELARNDI